MTFRDDHDATLARAEALERELEAAKQKLEANEDEQAKLREEIARLRERADTPRPAEKGSPREMVRAARHSALIGSTFIMVAVAAIVFTLMYAKSMQSSTTKTTAEPPTCTLTTVPSGAEIYDSRGEYIGTTPITRSTRSWNMMDDAVRYEARLNGHATATVILPTHGERCDTRVRLLP